MITLIIVFLTGLILGIAVTTWYLLYSGIAHTFYEEAARFRKQYFEANESAVKYFKEYIKLKGLLNSAFNLISVEYTFRRHSDIWKQFKGIETHDSIKKYLSENR